MKKLFFLVCFSLFLLGCSSEKISPEFYYRADFNPDQIDKVEVIIKNIAKDWNLRVFEKNRNHMKDLTQGKEAFFIGLYLEDNLIFDITNVGVGNQIDIGLFRHDNVSINDLKKLSDQVRSNLKKELQIDFELISP